MPTMQIHLLRLQVQPYLTRQGRLEQLRDYAEITEAVLAGEPQQAERACADTFAGRGRGTAIARRCLLESVRGRLRAGTGQRWPSEIEGSCYDDDRLAPVSEDFELVEAPIRSRRRPSSCATTSVLWILRSVAGSKTLPHTSHRSLSATRRAIAVGRVSPADIRTSRPGTGWLANAIEDYSIAAPDGFLRIVDAASVPSLTIYLSALGAVGVTAYFGVMEVCRPKPAKPCSSLLQQARWVRSSGRSRSCRDAHDRHSGWFRQVPTFDRAVRIRCGD